MQPDIVEMATGRWHGILPALGVREEFLSNKHGPCPVCGGRDRWRFDDKRGRGTWFCNGCEPKSGDGFALLQKLYGYSFREAVDQVSRVIGVVEPARVKKQDDNAKAKANCAKVWSESLPIESGDPVSLYLLRRVGVEKANALRHHPALPYRHSDGSVSYHPAMVALVSDKNGAGVTVHRTYLTEAGEKANVPITRKLMPGNASEGASIKLCAVKTTVGIAEGIETALAASRCFKTPVWACVSAGGLERWKPSQGIERVIIFGDNDESFTGQAAAYAVAKRLKLSGLAVDVRIPETTGKDWADA